MLLPHLKLRISSPSCLTASKSHKATELEPSNALAEVNYLGCSCVGHMVWILHLL